MRRIIFAVGLTGWAAIVALAWWLADRRIHICEFETDCVIRATAARDYVLIAGLSIGLALGLLALVIIARLNRQSASGSFTVWSPARRAAQPQLPR